MKKDITRAIIDATVDRSLKEIDEDPRRSVRKLADLGRYYSKGRLIQSIYEVMQTLLRNEDSPYYSAIDRLLHHTSRKALKTFGINIGLTSLTRGAKKIRSKEEKTGISIPWLIIARVTGEAEGFTPAKFNEVVRQGTASGVCSYAVRLQETGAVLEEVLETVRKYDDCAFFLFLPDEELTAAEIALIADCPGSITVFPCGGDCTGTNLAWLRKNKAWCASYDYYNDKSSGAVTGDARMRDLLVQETPFAFLIAEDGTSPENREKSAALVRENRINPTEPLILFDLYGDVLKIDSIVSDDAPCWLEILEDGSWADSDGSLTAAPDYASFSLIDSLGGILRR